MAAAENRREGLFLRVSFQKPGVDGSSELVTRSIQFDIAN